MSPYRRPALLLSLATALLMATGGDLLASSGAKPGTGIENELKSFLKGVEKNKPLAVPPGKGGKDPHGALDADKLLDLALRHLYAGKEAEAIKTLDMGISRNPRFHKFYGLRASIHLSKSRFGSALGDLKEALALNPDDAMLLVHRALAYRGFGNNSQAMVDLNKAIELKPDMMIAWYNRAALNVKLNKMDMAVKDFRKATEIAPKESVASYNLAMALEAAGKREDAMKEMTRLLGFTTSDHWKKTARSQLNKWKTNAGPDEKPKSPHGPRKTRKSEK